MTLNNPLLSITPTALDLFNLNFQSLEVVSRYRDPQLQVTENYCDLGNLGLKIYQCFKIKDIFLLLINGCRGANKTQNVYCCRHQCCRGKCRERYNVFNYSLTVMLYQMTLPHFYQIYDYNMYMLCCDNHQMPNISITLILYNVGPTSGRRCTNAIQIFCVCWIWSVYMCDTL